MKKIIIPVFFCIFIFGFNTKLAAQATDYKFQGMFIYNFAKYIEWPADRQKDAIVIGVLGNASIIKDLKSMMSDRNVNGRKFEIIRYNSIAELSKKPCHILFTTESSLISLAAVQDLFKNEPVLLITEKEGMAQKGSMINFV